MAEVKLPWPDWQLGEMIGRGGFGTVYSIKNQNTGEESALKVISLPRENSEIASLRVEGYDDRSIAGQYKERLDRIIEEYKFMARLKGHPNIVRCEDYESLPHADGIGWDVFIRMERLTSIPQYLMDQDHTLSMKDIVTLGIHICRALEACHQKDIVHRDIKPENIFISQYGDFKLGDFGIARTMDHTTNATHTGSYRYMAPEVFKNQKYDRTVDIYSLGLVLYWLLNNRRMPFLPTDRPPKASETDAAMEKRMSGKRMNRPLSGSNELKDVVMKACAYNRKNRFQSAEEMRLALELTPEAGGGQVTSGPGPSSSEGGAAPEAEPGTIGPAQTGPQTKGGSITEPGAAEGGSTVGSSWIEGGTVGAQPGGTTSHDPDPGETIGEPKDPKNPKNPKNPKKPGTPKGPGKGSPLTPGDPKDYVLRFDSLYKAGSIDRTKPEGSKHNPYIISLSTDEARFEKKLNKGSREVTLRAWPINEGLYYITESDGTKIYFRVSLYVSLIIEGWLRVVVGIGILVLTLHFYPLLGPFCILTVIFGISLLRNPIPKKLQEYEAERIKHKK